MTTYTELYQQLEFRFDEVIEAYPPQFPPLTIQPSTRPELRIVYRNDKLPSSSSPSLSTVTSTSLVDEKLLMRVLFF